MACDKYKVKTPPRRHPLFYKCSRPYSVSDYELSKFIFDQNETFCCTFMFIKQCMFADGPSKPKFTGGFRLFELDSCDNYGKVCLVYREPKQSSGKSIGESSWTVDSHPGFLKLKRVQGSFTCFISTPKVSECESVTWQDCFLFVWYVCVHPV